MIVVRPPLAPQEWERIREICCEAADGGMGLGDADRQTFFGLFWAGPYEALESDWSLVAFEEGKIVGYLTGSPDTKRFERRRRWRWDLPLLVRAFFGDFPFNDDVLLFLRRRLGLGAAPNSRFSTATKDRLRREFPAHLHMNLTASARGRGIGRRLIEEFVARLRARGIRGIHVFCGRGPLEFYRKTGFETLESLRLGDGRDIFLLIRSLQ